MLPLYPFEAVSETEVQKKEHIGHGNAQGNLKILKHTTSLACDKQHLQDSQPSICITAFSQVGHWSPPSQSRAIDLRSSSTGGITVWGPGNIESSDVSLCGVSLTRDIWCKYVISAFSLAPENDSLRRYSVGSVCATVMWAESLSNMRPYNLKELRIWIHDRYHVLVSL